MLDVERFLHSPQPGALLYGATRMALFDIEGAFWSLRRQLEALAGLRFTNAALQQAGANGGASFARSFVAQGDNTAVPEALRDCVAAYQAAGFGRFQLTEMTWPLGRIWVRGENSFEAWMLAQHGRQSATPACAYSAGVLVGFVNALAHRRDIVCIERTCQACGDEACTFELLPAAEAGDTAVVAFDPDPFLSQQLNLLDLLFDQMPMGIYILDPQLRLRRYNPTVQDFVRRYSSLPPEHIAPGISFLDLVPGNETAVRSVFDRVLAGETVRQEAFPMEIEGVVSYWDATSAPLRQGDEVVGIVHVSTSVTERVRAEQRLQKTLESLQRSEERLVLALRGATDGIWDWNLVTDEVYFSPRWKGMLGYAEDELPNTLATWQQLTHPDDRQQVTAVLQEYLHGRSDAYRVEHRLRHKDGNYRWILARGAVVRSEENGRPLRMAGSHTDITPRREAEERLQDRIAFENIITTISSNFINMPPQEIDAGIQRALETIGAFTGADRAYIFLYAADGRTMSCIQEWCAAGIAPQIDRLQALPVTELAWSNQQLQQGQTLHIPHVAALPPAAAAEKVEFQNQGIQSLLAVPLAYQEKVVGFLGFDAVTRQKEWTAVNISLLKIVGEIFVNALEHKRSREALQAANRSLEQRVAQRTQELERRNQESERRRQVAESLRDILVMLNSGAPLKPKLETIIRQAQQLLGADAGAIYHVDMAGQRVRRTAVLGFPPELLQPETLPLASTAATVATLTRQPHIIPDIAAAYAQAEYKRVPPSPELRVWLQGMAQTFKTLFSVPLIVSNELYGDITLYYRQARAFSEDDTELALTFGAQAALAIENARLVEAERQRRQESERRRQVAEGLRDILVRLNTDQPLSSLLDAIVAQADALLDSDVVALYLLHQESQTLKIQALRGDLPLEARQVELPIGVGTIGRVVALQQPMIVPDVSRLDIRMVQAVRAESLAVAQAVMVDEARLAALTAVMQRFQAVLALPLVAQEVTLGGLAFYYSQPTEFSDEEVSLATTFAGQAALAIQNARLRDHAEEVAVISERNRLARELHDAVTQTLFSASLIADVLPRIWERNPETGRAKLAELRELTRGALAEMRALLLELRPATLLESSLDELLRQLAAAIIGRSRVQVAVEVLGERQRPLPPDTQVALYRIAQEALNNVVKHAGADQVIVRLRLAEDRVELAVEDNGRGFDPATTGAHSLGLGIMRERAAKIGADLRVDSLIGKGTTIHVEAQA